VVRLAIRLSQKVGTLDRGIEARQCRPARSLLGNGGAQVAPNAHHADGARPRRRFRFPFLALLGWAVLVLVVPCVAPSLNIVDVLAFPLGFFMAAQGSLLALVLIAMASARRHDRIDAAGER
jgi:putative solute:sodium symporter small subunit